MIKKDVIWGGRAWVRTFIQWISVKDSWISLVDTRDTQLDAENTIGKYLGCRFECRTGFSASSKKKVGFIVGVSVYPYIQSGREVFKVKLLINKQCKVNSRNTMFSVLHNQFVDMNSFNTGGSLIFTTRLNDN